MRVLSFRDPADDLRRVDLFVEEPIEFSSLWERSVVIPLASTSVRVVSIADLIELKRQAARPIDLNDVEALKMIVGATNDE